MSWFVGATRGRKYRLSGTPKLEVCDSPIRSHLFCCMIRLVFGTFALGWGSSARHLSLVLSSDLGARGFDWWTFGPSGN